MVYHSADLSFLECDTNRGVLANLAIDRLYRDRNCMSNEKSKKRNIAVSRRKGEETASVHPLNMSIVFMVGEVSYTSTA